MSSRFSATALRDLCDGLRVVDELRHWSPYKLVWPPAFQYSVEHGCIRQTEPLRSGHCCTCRVESLDSSGQPGRYDPSHTFGRQFIYPSLPGYGFEIFSYKLFVRIRFTQPFFEFVGLI